MDQENEQSSSTSYGLDEIADKPPLSQVKVLFSEQRG